jgi:hypothetical protein
MYVWSRGPTLCGVALHADKANILRVLLALRPAAAFGTIRMIRYEVA